MLTIAPFFCFCITGKTCLQVMKTLVWLIAMTRCQLSSSASTGPPTSAIPTLLCKTSMRPKWSSAAATMAWMSTLLTTSAASTWHCPPSLRITSLVACAACRLRSTASTRAPSRAYNTAAALPLPQPSPTDPAPLTMTTLSSIARAMRSLRSNVEYTGGHETTVDRHRMTVDVRRVVTGQKRHRSGDFIGSAITSHWYAIGKALARLGRMHGLRQRRIDRPRRHAVDGNAMLGQLDCHLPRQADHGRLGGAIGGASSAGAQTRHRGDIDDASPFLAYHHACCMLTTQHHTADVDIHRQQPVVEREIEKWKGLGNASIADQYIATAVILFDIGKRLRNRLGLAHIHDQRCRLAVTVIDLVDRGFRCRQIDVRHQHGITVVRQPLRNCSANAHGSARHERHAGAAIDLVHVVSVMGGLRRKWQAAVFT